MPANIRTHVIFLETRIIVLHFATDRMGLSLFKCFWWAPKTIFSQKCVSAIQGHPRSLIFVPVESTYVPERHGRTEGWTRTDRQTRVVMSRMMITLTSE